MRKIIILLAYVCCTLNVQAQEKKNSANQLKAIKNGTTIFYADEGIDFTSQTFNNTFSLKGLKKIFRQYRVKKDDVKSSDENLSYNNFYVSKNEKIADGLTQYNSYYFVESKKNRVTVFWFGAVNKQDRSFERKYINQILNDRIPENVFQSLKMDNVDFAGRILKLNSSECQWMNINSIQCPYYGQISWSLHSSLNEATKRRDTQILLTKSKKGSEAISEEIIDVEFEGKPTKAIKIVYDIKGVNSLLAGMSGAKHLTVYYVSAEVRNTYVSCIMSYWNNDIKSNSGLVPLLDEIMKLK